MNLFVSLWLIPDTVLHNYSYTGKWINDKKSTNGVSYKNLSIKCLIYFSTNISKYVAKTKKLFFTSWVKINISLLAVQYKSNYIL